MVNFIEIRRPDIKITHTLIVRVRSRKHILGINWTITFSNKATLVDDLLGYVRSHISLIMLPSAISNYYIENQSIWGINTNATLPLPVSLIWLIDQGVTPIIQKFSILFATMITNAWHPLE